MGAALLKFAQNAHIDLVIDERLVRNRRAPPLRGVFPPAEALERLLANTDLAVRRTPDGVYVLYEKTRETDAEAAPITLPEIIVVGRRTQNADIRRTENDIQPYRVLTPSDVKQAQSGDLEDLFRARLPANAQARALSQNVSGLVGSARSTVDLRGLGPLNTLVLVDGRRLPGIPTLSADNDQPDLNGIPLNAIERIETLGGTAGGVYGPSALGGVVNIILKRDYDGADIQLTTGATSRGDAGHVGLDAHLGFSPNGGRTQVSIVLARQLNDPLRAGDRDYAVAARARQFRNAPADYVALLNTSNAVTVVSTGQGLTLKPQSGGASLGVVTTFLPIGFTGALGDAAKVLTTNAGQVPLDLADDYGGQKAYLMANRSTSSTIVSIRHQLLDGVDTYVDGLAYRTEGRFVTGNSASPFLLSAAAPTNPFVEPVYVRFPFPAAMADVQETAETVRVVAGLVVRLPRAWTLTGDASLGAATLTQRQHGVSSNFGFNSALFRGTAGLASPAPFGAWPDLLASQAQYTSVADSLTRQINHFSDISLRLAGPLASLPGGPFTMTTLLERRTESVPTSSFTGVDDGQPFTLPEDGRAQTVQSAYVELRAPLAARDAAWMLRGLEVQLAARYDQTKLRFASSQPAPSPTIQTRAERSAMAYTAGAKVYPLRKLMLRASIATGQLPPNFAQLTPQSVTLTGATFPSLVTPADPKRGGVAIGSDRSVVDLFGGDPNATGQRALTVAVGMVLNPAGDRGPRLAIDYSRIRRSHEIVAFPLDETGLMLAEALYQSRVIRAPLTDADRALGYTGGVVTELDRSATQTGETAADTIDARLDWQVRLPSSQLRLTLAATWQSRFEHRDLPTQPWTAYVGHFDGPTAWRGVAGVDWTDGVLGAGLSAQFVSGYRVTFANPAYAEFNPDAVAYQGGASLPAQLYVDALVRRQIRAPGLRDLEIILGVQNLFDQRPPIVAQPSSAPYSTYGDPRRRRFELTLSARL